ncbi:hypothetical protein EST38_g5070 [Candolleomyces aberdarensis]|uniref:Cytochrome P450 n=1 Tax=Candolleomyces aberdarensis TaxID=2316362 RepID=A0A4Q2DNA4_9AGAR|nr:hypothetical protein EST38_g5070 [Candolleomyces aberdarensis]
MSRPAPLSIDTDIIDSPKAVDALRSQFQEWDQEHAKMKERLPKDGRNYVRHARNILPLLESLSEIHPAAKVVVFTFRAVINFQYDRIENELRVNIVLLTQADVVRAVLEVHLVAQGRNGPSAIDSDERLLKRLRKIAEDIKECANAIDTYKKEAKLVKLYKSQEWKLRIMDFNHIFIEHRTSLLQLLSIKMARGVDDLLTKMDVLLSHAFNANQEWEKRVQERLRQYGSLDSWISDMPKVQKLMDLTEDDPTILGRLDPKQGEEKRNQRLNSFLVGIKGNLESTVQILCENNLGTFTKKLDFHTQQLQESISHAATYVVDQLSGPHGRLHHDDLKKLWKEMDWIFCVENKIFSMALHEYYRDRFSVKLPTEQDGEAQNTRKQDEDQWTLEYLGVHAQDICQAIDRDLSGYIRISEVNAFTDEIPEGWTFPQWCVYQGVGWHYEQQIYQKRLQYLLDAYYEVLPHVTPWNRGNVQETGKYLGLFHNLSRGPIIRPYHFLPPRFMEQIRQKVLKQSERYRAGFKKLAHYIDSDDTVRMLFEHNTVESYILPLCVLIMEHCVNVAYISKHYTVDLRDWYLIQDSIHTVWTVVGQRICNLHATFKDKKLNIENAMEDFKDGLYRVCYREHFYGFNEPTENIKWSGLEVECRKNDFDILDNVRFPPAHEGDPSEILAYRTWESFHPDADEIPPSVWPDDEVVAEYYASIDIEPREPSFFPRHLLTLLQQLFEFRVPDYSDPHTEDEYFDFADTALVGDMPFGSSFAYQGVQQDDEGESDEGGEEGGDEEGENDEGGEEAGCQKGTGSEAPNQGSATTSSHRSWHTLLVFQDKIAKDGSGLHSSCQGVQQQLVMAASAILPEGLNSSTVLLVATLGYVYFLLWTFGETKKIPPNAKLVKLPGFSRWTVLPAQSKYYADIVRAPDKHLSSQQAVNEFLQAELTLHTDEIGDNIQIPVIVNTLNRSLGDLVPLVHDEAVLAFDEAFPFDDSEGKSEDGWKSFKISRPIMSIVGRVSNRILVGLPLCRNEKYINTNIDFAVEVVVMSYILLAVPAFIRNLVNKLISPIPKRVKQSTAFIQPLIDERKEKEEKFGEGYEKPFDFLSWLMDTARKYNKPDRDVILRMMSTNFGSIHTTSLTFTNAMLTLLAHPQYIEPIREECDRCVQEEGWTKAAMDKMVFLDSFMKESQRVDVVAAILGNRLAISDFTLKLSSDGDADSSSSEGVFIPKGTMLAANFLDAHFDKAVWSGEDPDSFDPYRFMKIQKETGRQWVITTTSPNILTFGHGRHACPGRYLAAQEMKLMMAYLVMKYDMKLPGSEKTTPQRPRNLWIGNNSMPDPRVRVLLKRRSEASSVGL